jgi:cell wall-associated NlpC family hydrolase
MRFPGLAVVVLCAGALSACASTSAMSRPAAPTSSASVPGSLSEEVVQSALALVGTPYRYGGDTPQSGFDCSGFVEYVMGLEDVPMPRTVGEQYRVGQSVTRSRLQAGDLVFFSTTGPGPTHVGIVTDAEQGEFVHAPSDGSRVRLDRLDNEYWKRHWIGAKRVISGPRV